MQGAVIGRLARRRGYGGTQVSAIDARTRQITPISGVGEGPEGLAVSPDGTRLYVANDVSNTVSVVDTRTNTVVGEPIPVGKEPIGLAITDDGKTLYALNYDEATVSVIDTDTRQVVGTIPVGGEPAVITISPDGSRAYVTNNEDGTVMVIDTHTNKVLGEPIAVGREPWGVALTPDGERAYVVNFGDGTVSVIDTQTDQVVGEPIPVGSQPYGITLTPDGKRAYVANYNDGTVSVIDTQTDKVVGEPIVAGAGSWVIAMEPDQPPVASLRAGTATAGSPLSLDATASSDPDGAIATYAWSFGDGQSAIGTTPTISHTYPAPGRYRATLTLTDDEGCSTGFLFNGQSALCNGSAVARATVDIDVTPPPSPLVTPPTPASPGIATAARTAKVKGARALLRLRCRGGACAGMIKLTFRAGSVKHGAKLHRGSARRNRRARTIQLGRARFQIAAGQVKTVRVKLRAKARKLLRKAGRRGLKARLGGSGVRHRAIVLTPVANHRPRRRAG